MDRFLENKELEVSIKTQKGAGLAEYIVLLVLITIVIIVGLLIISGTLPSVLSML
jgi:Flp pilus assembly pilin Flp